MVKFNEVLEIKIKELKFITQAYAKKL